jgi:hypothetical protein
MNICQKSTQLIATSAIAICSMSMIATTSYAQSPATNQPATTAPISNDWKDYGNIEQGFMQGCMGTRLLPTAQRKVKQEFCQCAFLSYKNRYAPQTFMQMNALAVEIGDKGPALVNLMMSPEMDVCMTRTGFRP